MTEHRPYGACDGVPTPPAEPCPFMVPAARELLDFARRHHVLAVQGAAAARAALDAARRGYVRALVEAFAAGVPAEELARDGDAFARDMAAALAERGAP